MSEKISYHRARSYRVDEPAATTMQMLARESWAEDLAETRSQEEIDYCFPLIGERFEAAGLVYKAFARHGRLIQAKANDKLIGFAMMRNDVSPRTEGSLPAIAARTAKRVHGALWPHYSRVYPWLANVVVRPDYWRQDIGSSLVDNASRGFNMHQTSSAYIFDESQGYEFDTDGELLTAPREPFSSTNNGSKDFLESLGYGLSSNKKCLVRVGYFGPGSKPAVQYRLEAPVELIQAQAWS